MAKAAKRLDGPSAAPTLRRGASAAYLAAMRAEFDPADLALMVHETYDAAVSAGDLRARVETLKLILGYAAGKPAPVESARAAGGNRLQAALSAYIEAKAREVDAASGVLGVEDVIDV